MDTRCFASRASALAAALVAVLAAAILAGGALAAPPALPGAPAPDRTPPKAGQTPAAPAGLTADQQRRQDALLPVARHLAQQARAAGSDIAGVAIHVETGVVDVYRTDTNQPLRLPGGPPAGVKVVVHTARFSRGALIEASERVTHEAQQLGQQGVSVESVGPALDGSGITVSVLVDGVDTGADLERASTALHNRYGTVVGNVYGVKRKASADDQFFPGFRFNDYAPWYGGDRIRSSAGGCSTGFAATYNAAPAMLTAAHCGGVGTAFYNGPRTDGSFSYMGSSVYSNSGTDVNAIQVSSASNYINVGSALSPTQLFIGSWASPVVGQYLCQSGSYTGEVCGLLVVDTAQYVCQSWFLWWCTSWQGPLADVINSAGSGSYAAGHGDSGGPVYLRTGFSGIAVGLVHGVLTPNAQAVYPAYVPDTMWCPAPEGWSQRCSSGFSFAHMPGY